MLDLLWSKWGPVDREGCGVPQNGGNGLVLERYGRNGVLLIGRGWHTVHLRLFIHGLLFIQPPSCAPPPATVQPTLSTGSSSTTPPRATVHRPLHCLLFIQPSTGSCSSSPNTTGSCSSTPTRNYSSKPPQQCSLFIERQHRSASVSSSSEGIARSGSVNSHRSIAWVQ